MCSTPGSIRVSASREGRPPMTVTLPSRTAVPELAEESVERRPSFLSAALKFCRRQPLGTMGLVIVLVMFAAGVFADWIAPFDPEENDFSAAIVGGLLGLVLGVASAYFGGWFDLIFQRVLDVLMAFPLIILALAVVAVFGPGVFNVIVAITIPLFPRCGRVVRSSALAVREVPYVDAARALGFSHARIVLRHMMPNVLAPFLILLSAFVGQAILAEASLSYLGLGVQEPVPAWGLMLQGGAEEYATTAPWIALFPGVAIMLTVLGISLFGDALRDALDPKLRDR